MNIKKPAIEREAAWSDRSAKKTPLAQRKTAVVYVLAEDGADFVKVGRTTELRKRMVALRQQSGQDIQICFWAEFEKSDACMVETRAKRILKTYAPQHKGEWFCASPEIVAGAVCLAAEALQIKISRSAGFPGCPDETLSEIQEILSEPFQTPNKGRIDREFWCPQKNSVG